VPGLNIHMHFKRRIGEYEIACAELCGLGHYKMHAWYMWSARRISISGWRHGRRRTVMATAATVHSHAPQGFIRKYIFSLDHKVIGIQYFFLALTAVFVGMFLSLLMRIHLLWPSAVLPLVGEIKPETYLSLLTMHGTIMVFFVLTTAPQGGFGNYFLPIQDWGAGYGVPGAEHAFVLDDVCGVRLHHCGIFCNGGAPLHGWTGYAPLSALPTAGPGEGLGADLWITSIAIFCIASLMGALNFITTTLDLRARHDHDAHAADRVVVVHHGDSWAVGVRRAALGGILLLMDRNLGTSFMCRWWW